MSDVEPSTPPEAYGTVRVENPAYPVGYSLEVPGLGLVNNYEDRSVTEHQARLYANLGYEWPANNHLLVIQKPQEADDGLWNQPEPQGFPPPPDAQTTEETPQGNQEEVGGES